MGNSKSSSYSTGSNMENYKQELEEFKQKSEEDELKRKIEQQTILNNAKKKIEEEKSKEDLRKKIEQLEARGDVNACSGDDRSESARGKGVVPNGKMFPAPNDGLSKMGLGE
ncbi:hypothetical protein QYM36_008923 [Artemia franciscana]|uniref:Uncharacterized protein n=1 Tax=Artemia franciscana TaxID=6661 RepID=A0AA88I1V8_ARTSF|nr:hypothetical protein QYM36_008923 [Artemia franciscana]